MAPAGPLARSRSRGEEVEDVEAAVEDTVVGDKEQRVAGEAWAVGQGAAVKRAARAVARGGWWSARAEARGRGRRAPQQRGAPLTGL